MKLTKINYSALQILLMSVRCMNCFMIVIKNLYKNNILINNIYKHSFI